MTGTLTIQAGRAAVCAATASLADLGESLFAVGNGEHGPGQIRGLRERLIATYGNEGEFERRQDQLKAGVSSSQPGDDDGMAVYRLRLDPEGKEVLEEILGPLSAPQPTDAGPDLRSSDQRRGEALVQICRRATAAGGAAPVTVKAAVYGVDGGQTNLTNAALLCGRHHTIAHQRGWTATATTSEVTQWGWPGRLHDRRGAW